VKANDDDDDEDDDDVKMVLEHLEVTKKSLFDQLLDKKDPGEAKMVHKVEALYPMFKAPL
jgi:hypothetical protein